MYCKSCENKFKKKKILNICICLFILLMATACTYRTDYIKEYNDELHNVFGDFNYTYMGMQHDEGYNSLGAHDYKMWKIHFIDSYGKEKHVVLVNDYSLDEQIYDIYTQLVQRYLTMEILKDYFNTECNDKDTISSYRLYDNYITKEYNYHINIKFDFDFADYYDYDEEKIKDYDFFNMTNIDVNKLIDKGIVKISYIDYESLDKVVLSDLELDTEVNYLIGITKNINNIIPIEVVYYSRYKNYINYKGENSIEFTRDKLEF